MYNIKLIGPTLKEDFAYKENYKEATNEILPLFNSFITKALNNNTLINKFKEINIILTPIIGFDTILLGILYLKEKHDKLKLTIEIKKIQNNINVNNIKENEEELKNILKKEYNYNEKQIELFVKIVKELFEKNILKEITKKEIKEPELYLIAYQDFSENVNKETKKLKKADKKLYDLINLVNI